MEERQDPKDPVSSRPRGQPQRWSPLPALLCGVALTSRDPAAPTASSCSESEREVVRAPGLVSWSWQVKNGALCGTNTLAELTPTQKDLFDAVRSIFDRDVTQNFRVLVTFDAGHHPPVLEAINTSGVPCPKRDDRLPVHFRFNNSALFARNKSSVANNTGSDVDTDEDEVLRERQQLENLVEQLQEQLKVELAKLREINETIQKLNKHEAEISRNENFEFEVTVTKPVQVDVSSTEDFFTNCQQCHMTCHYPHGDDGKTGCATLGSDGRCTVCPGKCYWNVHFIQFRWDHKNVKEKQKVKELKEKYLKAPEDQNLVQALTEKLRAERDVVWAELKKQLKTSAEGLNRLKEEAQKPDPLTTSEYVDLTPSSVKYREQGRGRPQPRSKWRFRQKMEEHVHHRW
ncbi:hypothetical protein Q8A73_015606 [Channa argus]|nr:hypothetical protein Q8A73_015606 [Channa argus]